MTRCANPKPTKLVASPLGKPLAYCPGCKAYKPAKQVAWGSELRNEAGEIVASYAPIPHPGQETA